MKAMNAIAIGFGLCATVLAATASAQETPSQADKVHQAFENARQKQREKPSTFHKIADGVAEAASVVLDQPPSFSQKPATHFTPAPAAPSPVINALDAASRSSLP